MQPVKRYEMNLSLVINSKRAPNKKRDRALEITYVISNVLWRVQMSVGGGSAVVDCDLLFK